MMRGYRETVHGGRTVLTAVAVAFGLVGCGGSEKSGSPRSVMKGVDSAYAKLGGVVFIPQGKRYDPRERVTIVLVRGRVAGREARTFTEPGGSEFTDTACWVKGRPRSKLPDPGFLMTVGEQLFHAENMKVTGATPTPAGWRVGITFHTDEVKLDDGLPHDLVPSIRGRYTLSVERGTYRVTQAAFSADTEKLFGAKAHTTFRIETLEQQPRLNDPCPK
jgi:hypothetical protein